MDAPAPLSPDQLNNGRQWACWRRLAPRRAPVVPRVGRPPVPIRAAPATWFLPLKYQPLGMGGGAGSSIG